MSNLWPSVQEATILIIVNANTKIFRANDLGRRVISEKQDVLNGVP